MARVALMSLLVGAFFASAQSAEQGGWIELIKGTGLEGWRKPTAEWINVGDAYADPQNPRRLATRPGSGVLVNGRRLRGMGGVAAGIMNAKDAAMVDRDRQRHPVRAAGRQRRRVKTNRETPLPHQAAAAVKHLHRDVVRADAAVHPEVQQGRTALLNCGRLHGDFGHHIGAGSHQLHLHRVRVNADGRIGHGREGGLHLVAHHDARRQRRAGSVHRQAWPGSDCAGAVEVVDR